MGNYDYMYDIRFKLDGEIAVKVFMAGTHGHLRDAPAYNIWVQQGTGYITAIAHAYLAIPACTMHVRMLVVPCMCLQPG